MRCHGYLRARLLRNTALVLATATALAACSGGAAPSLNTPPPAPTPPPPPPTPTDPNIFRTVEYNANWALEAVNAAEAYALGYTGEGVIIGFVDFNFDLTSTELDIHPASLDPDPDMLALYEAQIGEPATDSPHGHAVAVTAAGLKNSIETHGVAFDAQVLLVDFFSGVNDRHVTQNGVLFHVSDPWTYLVDNGARVINKSLGYDEDDIIVNPPVVSEKYTIEWDAQAVAAGALLVVSAGNNSDPEPSLSVFDTVDILRDNNLLDVGNGALIIAGAVDQNNVIASFSDQAGSLMNYYMVAPGVDVVFPWADVDGPFLAVGSGTSFSAPLISGAAAIIMQRWPSLTGREVANVLFDSATDLGLPGIDAIYGHGLLNLNAALQPLGQSTLAVTGAGVMPLVSGAAISLGPAFGNGASLKAGVSDVMMLDGYNRDFQIDLSGTVYTQETTARLDQIVTSRRNWRASAVSLGSAAGLSFAVSDDDRERRALAFLSQSARDHGRDVDVIAQFSGHFAGLDLAAGIGQNLSDALDAGDDAVGPIELLSISGADGSLINVSDGKYGLAGMRLSDALDLKVGLSVAEYRGDEFHPVEALTRDAQVRLAAVRVDHYGARTRTSIEVGAFNEDGAVLGSRAVGGLALTNRATTRWLTVQAERRFGARFTASFSATAATTDPGRVSGSLFGDLETLASTTFTARLSGSDVWRKGDVANFSIHQPLRVERAGLTLVTGSSVQADNGDVIFGEQRLSLVPSGREIAFEAGYMTHLGDWRVEANAAWRLDADHVAGQRDIALLFGLNRVF